jgi:hypothetical protein
LLRGVWEHKSQLPASSVPKDTVLDYESVPHPLVVIMSPDCDLEWDFKSRFPEELGTASKPEALISHILLCDAFDEEGKIRGVIQSSDLWKRLRQNQLERYHHFASATIGDLTDCLPDLYLDFKKAFSIPTENLYAAVRSGSVEHIALIPPIYVHDLIHRFYSFLSRVGTPD